MFRANSMYRLTHGYQGNTGYSETSINGRLIKAVAYRNAVSIAGPERPSYVHNVLL